MRRGLLLSLALVLTAVLAVDAAHAAKPKKLESLSEIEGYEIRATFLRFFGDVHSKKNKCERERTVTVRNVGPNGPGVVETVGTATTDHTGDFDVSEEVFVLDGGPYVAEVERKKLGKGQKRLVCKAATSASIFVPELD